MRASLLIAWWSLAATAAPPHLPRGATAAAWVPRLEALSEWKPFLETTSPRSSVLRAGALGDAAFALLRVDPFDPVSLTAAGIDATSGSTTSFVRELTVTCFSVKDTAAFDRAVEAQLATLGTPWSKAVGAARVSGSRDPLNRVLGGAARLGKEACVAAGQDSAFEALLLELPAALKSSTLPAGFKTAASLKGSVFLIRGADAIGLKALHRTLTADANVAPRGTVAVSRARPGVFGPPSASALASFRAHLDNPSAERLVNDISKAVAFGCPGCDPSLVQSALRALLKDATGQVWALASSLDVRKLVGTRAARLASARGAILLETRNSAGAEGALKSLAALTGATLTDGRLTIPWGTDKLVAEVRQTVLGVATDPTSLEEAFARGQESAADLAHGLEFRFNAAVASKTFGSVGLGEVLGMPELAGFYAAGTELLPLLGVTEELSGSMDTQKDGRQRVSVTWRLASPKSALP